MYRSFTINAQFLIKNGGNLFILLIYFVCLYSRNFSTSCTILLILDAFDTKCIQDDYMLPRTVTALTLGYYK